MDSRHNRPRIGITTDNDPDAEGPGRYRLSRNYARAVAEAGGLPVMLAQQPDLVAPYLDLCDAFIFTGGRDPHMDAFGQPTHAEARLLDPTRQAFELALLQALDERPDVPVLGVCLGMQMMALNAGGQLNQHLADTLGEKAAAVHQRDSTHPIELRLADTALLDDDAPPHAGTELDRVTSCHHQAVADPGALRTVATAPDGTIEAIDAPSDQRRFYLGVQWHPERGPDGGGPLNQPLFLRLVDAARATTSARSP